MSETPEAPFLPPGYEPVRHLARRSDGEEVLHARRGGRAVVLRLSRAAAGDQRAELAVLAALDHPGLAPLVDHGSLPSGVRWVARGFVEGQTLDRWAEGRTGEEIGRVVARLCPALEALHRAGFVHSDLKAENVIVRDADDAPVLTDFGLARARDAEADVVSGSFFHVAPEVLLGCRAEPRSDLFALGVLLYDLLVGIEVDARAFYGRFPARDFLESVNGAPERLPSWARDLVTSLVARDPAERPPSSAALGRALGGRLGLRPAADENAGGIVAELAWTPRGARPETFAAVHARASAVRRAWIALPEGEPCSAWMEELALEAALGGAAVRRVDVARLAECAGDGGTLEARARELAAELDGARAFVALGAGGRNDAWAERALELCDAALVVVAPRMPTRAAAFSGERGTTVDVAPLVLDDVRRFMRARVASGADQAPRVDALASLLWDASAGSAERLARALRRLAGDGALVAGDGLPRLRPGPLPRTLASEEAGDAARGLDANAVHLWCALDVAGGRTSLATAAGLCEQGGDAAAGAAAELARAGVAALAPGEMTLLAPPPADSLPPDGWRALHARRAELNAREGLEGPASAALVAARVLSGAEPVDAALEAARAHADRGAPELALEICEAVLGGLARSGLDPNAEAPLRAELGVAWCQLGRPERGLAAVAPLAAGADGDAAARAALERVHGQAAWLRHRPVEALEHFEAMLLADPAQAEEAWLGKARLLVELRREREALDLIERLAAGAGAGMRPPGFSERGWNNLRAIEAMCRWREGDVEAARASLERQVGEALAAGDEAREAGLRINLGTLERRSGDPARALGELERAERCYERAGHLPRLAQARALYGGALRDAGELARAQEPLASALTLRERLSDEVGALAVRGMLGLLHAERGHARPAIEELETSAAGLRAAGRSVDAAFLAARAAEMRVRIGDRAAAHGARMKGVERGREHEGDPRILTSHARAAWLSGDERGARELVERAGALARRLGRAELIEEIELLRLYLDGPERARRGDSAGEVEEQGSARAEDLACARVLARAPFDVDRARALVERLVRRGRDDRAARVLIALAVRGDPARRDERAHHAEELLRRVGVGATATEAVALRRSLLGVPDPWPEDLTAFDALTRDDEEIEMDVLKLLEINHRLVTQDDLGGLLGTIVEQALSVSGAQRGFLILEKDGELEIDTALDSRRGGIDGAEVEVSGSVLREALDAMRPVLVSNALEDPRLGAAPSVIALDLRSILCVPFDVADGLRGVIYVDHRLREGAFAERAERMLTLLADQAALAIRQVRRMEEIRRLNGELNRRVVRQQADLETARRTLSAASLPQPASGLIGASAAMERVRRSIDRAASTRLSVMICGPSGSGKEVAARALHASSERAERPFVGENCAALPSSLIEAELFGARRGAYTGSERDRAGLFERASGGTLFLDEIGELPIELQAKLLRVLETGEVRRIGDDTPRAVDVRLVAATNRDLAREVAEGRFRADLMYRLDGLRLDMPSLAERVDDIPILVDHYLRLRATPGEAPCRLSAAVMKRLCRRAWPGNVRELFNEVERLCVMSEGDVDDPDLVRDPALDGRGGAGGVDVAAARGGVRTLAELEREAIERALAVCGGDKAKAAQDLGISRAKIYQRLKEWREQDAE